VAAIIKGLVETLGMDRENSAGIDWDAMEVGDGAIPDEGISWANARVIAYRMSRKLNRSFRTKKKGGQVYIVRLA